MRKPEQLFYDLIKKYLPGDVSRIENTADAGTPDLTCAAYGRDFWIELKSHPEVKYKDDLRQVYEYIEPSQRVWHARRSKFGSLIFVICRFEDCIIAMFPDGTNYQFAFRLEKKGKSFDWERLKEMIRFCCDHTKLVF